MTDTTFESPLHKLGVVGRLESGMFPVYEMTALAYSGLSIRSADGYKYIMTQKGYDAYKEQYPRQDIQVRTLDLVCLAGSAHVYQVVGTYATRDHVPPACWIGLYDPTTNAASYLDRFPIHLSKLRHALAEDLALMNHVARPM